MSEKNESFAETLNLFAKQYLKENDYMYDDYHKEDLQLFESIIKSFEIFGGFLDCVPMADRYEIIYSRRKVFLDGKNEISEGKDGLLKYIRDYSGRSLSVELFEKYRGVDRPHRKVNKHMKIIENFEHLVSEVLRESIEGEYYIPYNDELETTIEAIEALKDDLENKKFKIFSRTNYYAWEVETKTPLNNFLEDLINHYKIDKCKMDKKQLIENF